MGTARIDLAWNAPRYTGGVSIIGYRIEASDDGGSTWKIIRRNTNARTTTYSDVNLRPATTRHYRVAAINLAGVGKFSNTARATTDATLPGVPRRLSADAVGTSQIGLSWQAPSDDGGARVTGYRIEVSDDGGRSWEDLVANTRTTATVHTHTGLAPASTRHYRVSAINRIGVGNASRVAGSTTDATVPDAPTGLMANDVTPTQIDPRVDRACLQRRRPHHRLPHRGLGDGRRLGRPGKRHAVHGHGLLAHRPAAGERAALPGLGDQPGGHRRALGERFGRDRRPPCSVRGG